MIAMDFDPLKRFVEAQGVPGQIADRADSFLVRYAQDADNHHQDVVKGRNPFGGSIYALLILPPLST